MENPKYWGEAEKTIYEVWQQHEKEKSQPEAIFGFSLPARIARALRAKGLLNEKKAPEVKAEWRCSLCKHGVTTDDLNKIDCPYCERGTHDGWAERIPAPLSGWTANNERTDIGNGVSVPVLKPPEDDPMPEVCKHGCGDCGAEMRAWSKRQEMKKRQQT